LSKHDEIQEKTSKQLPFRELSKVEQRARSDLKLLELLDTELDVGRQFGNRILDCHDFLSFDGSLGTLACSNAQHHEQTYVNFFLVEFDKEFF
jgi:hypothetical protein